MPLAVVGVVMIWSWPGQPTPFNDMNGDPIPGSIAEKIRIPVNGVEQGMIIKARDRKKPVLLYLHGGMPEYCFTEEPLPG